jgi:hypothetical protein
MMDVTVRRQHSLAAAVAGPFLLSVQFNISRVAIGIAKIK